MKISKSSRGSRLALASLLTLVVSCSSDVEPRQVKRDTTNASTTTGDNANGSSGSKPGVRTTTSSGESGNTNSPSSSSNTGSGNTTSTGNGSSNTGAQDQSGGMIGDGSSVAERTKASKDFFELTLAPKLESACIGCHVGPRVPDEQLAGPRGDEEVYVVEVMFERMTDGSSSTENAFYTRVSNVNNDHPGGDRCAIDQTICDDIIEFGQLWYEDDGSLAAGSGGFGFLNVDVIRAGYQGWINGWAYDAAQPDEQFMVEIYNGTIDAGTLLVSTLANGMATPLSGASIPPGHEFEVKIPDAMIASGIEMDIHAYAIVGGVPQLVGNIKETFYVPSAEGAAFFNANIAAAVQPNDCGGCHSAGRDLEGIFSSMVNPKPSNGGTATNNIFYQTIADIIDHSGGDVRGQGNIGNLIQQWWDIEFGP